MRFKRLRSLIGGVFVPDYIDPKDGIGSLGIPVIDIRIWGCGAEGTAPPNPELFHGKVWRTMEYSENRR
jgi:hypothetical protein